MNKLQNKFAVVTGGAGFLGIEHCKALIEGGATVFVADIDVEKIERAINQLGKNAIPLCLDVTSEESVKNGIQSTINHTKHIDILINNAAIDPKVTVQNLSNREFSRIENFSMEDWSQQVNVGLTGAFIMSKIIGSSMAASGRGGVILNIASDLSVIAPDQRLYMREGTPIEMQPVKPITYSVVKTALIGMTRYLAAYWAKNNIRVNALSPGGVYNDHPKDFTEKISTLIPMGRMARKDEYRGVVQFMCSDDSTYMTGQNIIVDGGRTII